MVKDNEGDIQQANHEDENKNDENYIFDIPLDFQPDEGGVGNVLFTSMKEHRNLVAQYITTSHEEEYYDEVLERCIRTALHLKWRNLSKNDVVMLCSDNQKYAIVPFIASLFLTVPVASLDPTLSLLDISHLMKEVKPKILFVIPEVIQVIEASLEAAGVEVEIVVYGESDKYTEFSSFLQPHEDEDKFTPELPDSLKDPAAILFSSGTTGLPKGIVLNHFGLLVQGHILLASKNVGPVSLSYATLYWISAILFLIASVQIGGARLVCPKFDAKEFWYLIDRYKVTSMFLAPSSAIAALKAGRPDGIDTTNFWNCLIGGASIPEKQLLELRDMFPGGFVFQGYGQSEAGILTFFKTNVVKETLFLHNKPKSVGLPVPGTICKVVDPETEIICGPNEQGELRVKSKSIMNGYYNRDSSESFDSDGWLRTGDIVYYDEDGCFFVVDRIKEMLKYKSFHVAPAMLEQIIMTHPSVSEAIVVGIPHDEDGDHPMALIIPNEGSNGNIDKEEIKNYVEEQVPDRMKLRGGIKIISSFPMTPSGKIKRRELRDLVLKGVI